MPARSRRETPARQRTRNAPSAAGQRPRGDALARAGAERAGDHEDRRPGGGAGDRPRDPRRRAPRRRVRWRLRVPRKRSVTGVVARVTAGSQPGDWLRVVISTGP